MLNEFEVRDFREKNFYWQDNEYLNGYARLCGVSATAVYLSLCRHSDKKQNCFPSIKLIAEEHNISERTVINAIKILEKHNIIKKEKIRKDNGKWLNNSYILLNKSQWISQVQPLHMDSQVQITTEPSANNDVSQVQPLHTNKKHINKIHIEQIANETFADNINPLIKLFEAVNPTYERLFSNRTQRAALERLVKKFGEPKTRTMIEVLPQIINKPYAPKITTPLELERDLGKLKAFYEQEKGRGNTRVIKV